MLGISYRHGPAVFRVLCAFARAVLFQSPRQIIRDAGIQTGVRTFQDVDDPLHRSNPTVSGKIGREMARRYMMCQAAQPILSGSLLAVAEKSREGLVSWYYGAWRRDLDMCMRQV